MAAGKRNSELVCNDINSETSHAVYVSVLIPGEDTEKYLLARTDDRGWWLPYGVAQKGESIKLAAHRVATEVGPCFKVLSMHVCVPYACLITAVMHLGGPGLYMLNMHTFMVVYWPAC